MHTPASGYLVTYIYYATNTRMYIYTRFSSCIDCRLSKIYVAVISLTRHKSVEESTSRRVRSSRKFGDGWATRDGRDGGSLESDETDEIVDGVESV